MIISLIRKIFSINNRNLIRDINIFDINQPKNNFIYSYLF
jgi:hypothetical protein